MQSFRSPPAPPDWENVLARFEEAWRKGPVPSLDQFLPPGSAADPQAREATRQLLGELVKIDLNYRWLNRHGGRVPPVNGKDCPGLEDYVTHFPALVGPVDRLDLDLIGAEYWVRHCYGDRPSHQDYVARFPRHGPQLLAKLRQLDQELSTEKTGNLVSPAVATPAPVPAAPSRTPGPLRAGPTVEDLIDTLRRSPLLAALQLDALVRDQARFTDPRALAKVLLQHGWLTPFQVNLVLQGRSQELVLGPYVLLERLGEGGAGQIYKARHQVMQRVVAIKTIRKELLEDAEAVSRFHREIQVISQLTHANVVTAHDAGFAGGTHFLAMELVEGIDLAQLVKRNGPLPIEQARLYIGQAALGLQHIHERGLVHRDIKPSNLLVSGGVVSGEPSSPTSHHSPVTTHQVKILDLGLARLQRPNISEAAGGLTGPDAIMMGTLDYMSPEQAVDAHGVDIRADIYSLGCTFHFLLTGQPPFPGGTLTQKLLRHQQAEPPPLERFRGDVPATLQQVLRKMMAKRPEDRYATPVQVAQALDAAATLLPVPAGAGRGALVPVARLAPALPAPSAEVIDAEFTERRPLRRRATAACTSLFRRFQTLPRKVQSGIGSLAVLGFLVLLLKLFLGPTEPKIVFLSDLPEQDVGAMEFGKGEERFFMKGGKYLRYRDKAPPEQRPITLKGESAEKGIYMRPPRSGTVLASYQLDKKFQTFKATVGLNDGGSATEGLFFTVIGDGKPLWKSKEIKFTEIDECTVDVSKVTKLTITAYWGVPNSACYPVWGNPRLIR